MTDYSFFLASFVGERDGMAVELRDSNDEVVAEVFEDDESGVCMFAMPDGVSVPVPLIWELLRRAVLEFPGAAGEL